MVLAGKLGSEIEIKAAAEKYYTFYKDKVRHLPNISPNIIQQVEVHEGSWDTHGHGSIKIWNYTVGIRSHILLFNIFMHKFTLILKKSSSILRYCTISSDGKPEVFKEQVEFDDENMAVTFIGLEGDVFEHYKTIKLTYKVVPKGPEHSLVIMTYEYEKLDDDTPYPYKYLDLMNNFTKDIESHLKE